VASSVISLGSFAFRQARMLLRWRARPEQKARASRNFCKTAGAGFRPNRKTIT